VSGSRKVAEGEWLRVEQVDMQGRSIRRMPPRGPEVGERAWLPMEP
jgi:hypothetical protein